jgi:hypothetical protein|tara:strand:- start:243 stop:515 length:273 start_codon:yes stop_codon:yes gene_type:complete
MAKVDKYTASKLANGVSRTDGIDMKSDTRDSMEAIGVAHLATGNTQEAIITFGLLNKTTSQNDITPILNQMAKTNDKLLGLIDDQNKDKK